MPKPLDRSADRAPSVGGLAGVELRQDPRGDEPGCQQGVAADISVIATVTWIGPLAVGMLIAGVVLVGLAILLLVLAFRAAAPHHRRASLRWQAPTPGESLAAGSIGAVPSHAPWPISVPRPLRLADVEVQNTEVQSDRVLTLPNVLSALRLLGVPLFLWLILVPQADGWAVALLMVAGFTDWLDGYLARKWNQITRVGSYWIRWPTASTFWPP